MKFFPVIGLEVHVEPKTLSKMFCGCSADHFGHEPNTHVCAVCFGLPGALPVANVAAIRQTVKTGLALNCQIARDSKFDRKNYFYPDLPKGYQVSQYDEPLCEHGSIMTSAGSIGIHRIHLEEDTAKLQHVTLSPAEQEQVGTTRAQVSLIDFNRSGVALIEIVTEPDIHSPEQAKEYAKSLVQLLRALDVSDCDMEKGSLRLEANISVQTEEEHAAGTLPAYKVEVKNLNSFRYLERAIRYEIARQSAVRESGAQPKQETRGWNDAVGETYAQRSKENAEDYRYFPDPDLPPLHLDDDFVAAVRAELPELPAAKAARWTATLGVSAGNALVLTSDREVSEMIEPLLVRAAADNLDAQRVANALVNHKVTTWLLDSEQLTGRDESEVQAEYERVLSAVHALHAAVTVDARVLQDVVRGVIEENTDAVEKYRAGKKQVLGFLIGQVMRRLPEKGDTKQVQAALTQELQQ